MKMIRIGAVWCPSCIVQKGKFKKLDTKGVEIIDLDVDIDVEEVKKYSVDSILPLIILVDKNDCEVKRFIGEKSIEQLEDIINMCI